MKTTHSLPTLALSLLLAASLGWAEEAVPQSPKGLCPKADNETGLAENIARRKPFSADTMFLSNMGFLKHCLHDKAQKALAQPDPKDPYGFDRKNWISLNEARRLLVAQGFDTGQIKAMEDSHAVALNWQAPPAKAPRVASVPPPRPGTAPRRTNRRASPPPPPVGPARPVAPEPAEATRLKARHENAYKYYRYLEAVAARNKTLVYKGKPYSQEEFRKNFVEGARQQSEQYHREYLQSLSK